MIKKHYFYPLIIALFLISFHFYSFYQKSFFQMINLIKNKRYPTLYEKIQSENPYYEIWLLAKAGKNIYFIFEDKSDKNLDYNTTYFKQKQTRKKVNYYLSELKLNIDYFFYPKEIKPKFLWEVVYLYQGDFKKGDMIISDYELDEYWEKINSQIYSCVRKTALEEEYDKKFKNFYKRLKRLPISKKNFIPVNRHPEKPYYIYQVVN
jgi:hypothetical protein